MKNKFPLFLAILLMSLSACNQKSSPENTLRNFINYRFEEGQSRQDILDMLDNPLREKVENMDAKAFNEFADTSNLRKAKFIINVKNCVHDSKCFLTYTLKYQERIIAQEDEKQKFKMANLEVKKIAEIVSPEPDVWKIADVSIVKSYIEGRDNIEVGAEGVIQVP